MGKISGILGQHMKAMLQGMTFVDLHCHSIHSDGNKCPVEMLQMAKHLGLAAFSITDHNTSDSILRLHELSKIAGGIRLIHGMELTTFHKGVEVHILVYGINPQYASAVDEFTKSVRAEQEERTRKVIGIYNSYGLLEASYEDIAGYYNYPGKVLTLLQVLAYCVEKRNVRHEQVRQELFRPEGIAYLRCDKSCFVTPAEAVRFAQDVGGVPVLAHPGDYGKAISHGRDEGTKPAHELIKELIGHGLKGIEAAHSRHSSIQIDAFRRMAKELQLLATAGSDWHGFNVNQHWFGSFSMLKKDLEHLLYLSK